MARTAQVEQEFMKNPLWFYIKANRRAFSIGMIFLVATNTIDGLYPLVLKRGIDQITAHSALSELFKTSTLFFAMMAGLAVTRYCWRTFFGEYHTLAAEDLRNRLFHHMTQMGPNFFYKNSVGELMSLITNDVQSFRQGIGSGVLVLVDAITIVCVVLPVMIMMNPAWTFKTLIFLPLVPFIIWKLTKLIFQNYRQQQDDLSALSGVSQEIVSGIRVIKSFAQEKTRLGIYNKISQKFETSSNRTAVVDALFMPVMEFGVASGSVILLFVAAPDVLSGVATLGTLVAFQRYIQKMVWPMTALGLGVSQYQKAMASFSRMAELFEQQTDIPDQGSFEMKTFESMKIQNLSYKYPDSQHFALKNLNFEIQAGETVGLIGAVGSGKSTLLHLLNRLYPAPPESILVNGESIEKFTQSSLHSQVVLVPQEAFLFSDSVRDNISFSEESVGTEGVQEWAKLVDIDKEIEILPHKFDSQLGERGVNLSGGQKQRLTIARGLMVRAPFIMLDDSLSAVDTKTEKAIQDRLNLSPGLKQTKLIVSHRLTSLRHADKIIVLNDGEIEAMGTHAELLKHSTTYLRLAEIQGAI
jgi:ATP-binding cassette subfamily B multidrug efflux pump